MEIAFKKLLLITLFSLVSCSTNQARGLKISDVFVADFGSDDIDSCKPSDVDLNNDEAKKFFVRSRRVEYKVIHDHYNFAPCYIEGTLTKGGKACDWQIRAGATGHIQCDNITEHYVCDSCDDFFQ